METDTVHVRLPPGLSLQAVTDGFRRYGEVARIELVPGDALAAAVVFFDVRSARRLLEAMGEAARPAPPSGHRTVRLPGSVRLDPQDVSQISSIKHDKATGEYTIEFFDVRRAASLCWAQVPAAPMVQSAAAAFPAASSTDCSIRPGGSATAQPAKGIAGSVARRGSPQRITSTLFDLPEDSASLGGGSTSSKTSKTKAKRSNRGTLSVSNRSEQSPGTTVDWKAPGGPTSSTIPAKKQAQAGPATVAAGATEYRWPSAGVTLQSTVVGIRGLPNGILSKPCFEAVLQQAGLIQSVVEYQTSPRNPCGEATVRLSCPLAAAQCVMHFAGRQWAGDGTYVTAWLLPSPSGTAPGLGSGATKVAAASHRHSLLHSGATEASTDAGISELDDEQEGDEA